MPIVQSGGRWHSVNFVGTGGTAVILWEIARVLASAGWTHVRYSDGVSVTAGTPGANPLAPGVSWLQMRAPTGTNELVLAKTTGDLSARILFAQAGFGVTGAPTTSPDVSTSERIELIGSNGNYTSFSYSSGAPQDYLWHICADPTPYQGAYYFHIVSRRLVDAGSHRVVVVDPCETTADGAVGIADAAPWVAYTGSAAPSSGNQWSAYYRYGQADQALEQVSVNSLWGSNQTGINPYTGLPDIARAVALETNVTHRQTKGVLRTIRYASIILAAHERVDPDSAAMIALDSGFLIPWPASTPPAV